VAEPWEVRLRNLPITARAGAPPDAEMIVLPTDRSGTPGTLNGMILEQLGYPGALPRREQLERGYHVARHGEIQICFVVTVGEGETRENLQRNLHRALGDPVLHKVASLWIPLMGTGAGGLSQMESMKITLDALATNAQIMIGAMAVTISMPPELDPDIGKQLLALVTKSLLSSVATALGITPPGPSPEDPLAFERTPALDAALDFSARLFKSATDSRRGTISSTCLFIALAESRLAFVPYPLRADLSTSCFSAVVHNDIGAPYARVRDTYLGSDGPLTGRAAVPRTQFSDNAKAILAQARAAAGDAIVTTDHLIIALLGFEGGKARERLAQAGVDFAALLGQYRSARIGRVAMRFSNDLPTNKDRLGYEVYARAICDFLTHADTPPPLSISIQAPWGGGKSTLMKLVRDTLDPPDVRDRYKPKIGDAWSSSRLLLKSALDLLDKRSRGEGAPASTPAEKGRRWTMWFNAWKYDTTEQVWAGLVDAIVSQVADRLEPIQREKFLFQLQLARIDDGKIRKRIHDRVLSSWIARVWPWTCAGIAALVGLCSLGFVDRLLLMVPGLGVIVGPALLLNSYFKSREKTKAEPAALSLGDYIRVPDYEKHVGELHQIHADLRRVLAVVPRTSASAEKPQAEDDHTPLVIFIDDLDRCSPSKVAAVVEGVSMLLASDTYRCMFVIGMDPQIVAAALEKAHEDMRKQLPPYERAVPIGWRFMDKFVQLPFTVPPAAGDKLQDYVEWLADPEGKQRVRRAKAAPASLPKPAPTPAPDASNVTPEDTPAPAAPAPPPVDPRIPAVATTRDYEDSLALGTLLDALLPHAAGTPREMKRMINVARFYLALRAARIEVDPSWSPPSPAQYARWIVLTLRWPDMMRWLQWGADEAHWDEKHQAETLTCRRLKVLEAKRPKIKSAEEWRNAIEKELKTRPAPKEGEPAADGPHWATWAGDPKLFQFFQVEAALPKDERLSDASRQGFW